MKIGILTLPLRNNNYGGLLQAYALQKVLKDMGHEVWIINRVYKEPSFIRKCASLGKRFILKYIFKKNKQSFFYKPTKEEKKIVATYAHQFIKSHFVHITKEITKNKDLLSLNKKEFDAFIVGSDQVWRPEYSPCVTNYFLDFVKNETKIKRIAYAASFGVSNWKLTKKQTRDCSRLAKNFDAISVREDSGIDLCREFLHVDAVQVLDPTMLLDTKDYIQLVENEGKISSNLMTYILDKTDEKQQIINDASEKLKLSPFSVIPNKKLTKETRADIKECIYPAATYWIRGFIDAQFVITDSFHGCVFSILFNKPFIAIGNLQRGMTRFNSLLKMFELEDRLVHVSDTNFKNLFIKQINWTKVNSILVAKREEAKLFLSKNLTS